MEFENLQIEVPIQDETESQLFGVKIYEKKYHNKEKNFVVGFNPNSKEFLERKARRARRFGVKEDELQKNDLSSDLDLFKDINLENLSWPPVPDEALEEIRPEAILLYGVNDMSTKDVFAYFKLFGPESLEWIDDSSCNVVWEDEASVPRAIDGVSKSYAVLKKYRESTNPSTPSAPEVIIKEEVCDDAVVADAIEVEENEINPKDVWRIGLLFNNKQQLFLRPATVKDKKLPGAASRSEYYLRYGKNPGQKGNKPGVLSKSRKRKLQQMQKLVKQPDVKICDLADLKREGIIHKMDVDEDEPTIKRPNVNKVPQNPMTMIADRHELKNRLGMRENQSVHERLEIQEKRDRSDVHDRLGASVHDRLGSRDKESDARNEIRSCNRSSKPSGKRYGYEDENGIYHDIYRADDVKEEDDDNYDNRTRSGSSALKDRLGSRKETDTMPDLRNKLRKSGSKTRHKDVEIKPEEEDADKLRDKVNLCIEIKQEQRDAFDDDVDMDDEDFEF